MLLESDPVTVNYTASGLVDVAALASATPFATGLDAVVIGVRTRLQLIAGEWFLDLDSGVPWYEDDGVDPARVILGSKYDEARVRVEILRAILATPGVEKVTSLVIQFNTAERNITVTWSAQTKFGNTEADTLTVGAQ